MESSSEAAGKETVRIKIVGPSEGKLLTAVPIPEGDLNAQPFPEGDLKTQPFPEGDLKAQPIPEGDLKAQPFPEGDLKAQPFPEGDLKAQPFPEVERDIPAYLKKYYDYKADALGPGCLKVISQHLNCPAVGFSQYNLPKDWTGMAECLGGYSYHDLQDFERNPNPTEALLSDWKTRSGSTIKQLLECIHDIGRFDLLEGDRLHKTLGK